MSFWVLRRVFETPERTWGVLGRQGRPFCVTMEDPWRFNESNFSCIPPGVYTASPYVSSRFGNTWELDVPGRTYIIIHPGNTEKDTEGCILLGSGFVYEAGNPAIWGSRMALDRFREEQPWKRFEIRIVGVTGTA